MLYSRVPYTPPAWIAGTINPALVPSSRLVLGMFPTPLHPFRLPHADMGLEFFIKRDDLSSFDLSGNKVRKLEFLLGEALEKDHDCVVTIGGVQSNHCRATAVAARQLGLDPYLVLRTRNAAVDDAAILNTSVAGNLLFNRMVDAEIHTVSAQTYATVGSATLLAQLTEQLVKKGRRPYPIPVGGSTPLGAFGYLTAMDEICRQQEELGIPGLTFDHIIFSCGSGGTAAGVAIGARLSGLKAKVHAVGVCDTPSYFYEHIRETAAALGVDMESNGPVEEWLTVHAGSGVGYARSTPDELEFILQVAKSSGIILDPVYSGKALYYFLRDVIPHNPGMFQRGDKILFIHTGGQVGLYDKAAELAPLLPAGRVMPMAVQRPT